MGNFGRKVDAGLIITTPKGNNTYSLFDTSSLLIHTVEMNTKITTNYCRITLGGCGLEPGAFLTYLTVNSPSGSMEHTDFAGITACFVNKVR